MSNLLAAIAMLEPQRRVLTRLGAGLGLLALVPLCATCGTVRAVQGDHEATPPTLVALSPTQVVSGQLVTFVADVIDVTGDNNPDDDAQPTEGRVGDVLYFWDFGGGAEPNTSIDPIPSVQIRDGQRSPYSAHLTLTDPGGDAKKYDFTLFVTPLAVTDVVPATVIAGSNTQFFAVVQSGTVESYTWDFGGAAIPGGSSQQAPAVTLTDTPGAYDARVIVSNKYESVEFPFTITVTPVAGP